MAGDAIVGALRVVLGMDTGSYEDGAKKASSATKDFFKAASEVAAGIQLQKIIDKLVDSFTNNVAAAINFGNELLQMSQKVGMSVEQLSSLRLAASLNSLSMEELTNSFSKFGKSVTDAVGKPMGQAALAFRAFGVDVAAIAKLSPAEQINVMADAISRFRDSAAKTQGVTALFGEGAAKLIPLFDKGAAGL